MFGFMIILFVLGYAFDYFTYRSGSVLISFLIFAVIWTLISYYLSARVALKLNGARPATREEQRYLVNVVEGLSIAAGIPRPKIYLIDSESLNAFATGRDPEHAYVAITTGLLNKLDRQEIEGVMAHEISHIKNYDIRVQTIAVMLAGFIVLISDVLQRYLWWGGFSSSDRERRSSSGYGIIILIAISLFAVLFAELLKLAVSRQREYLADGTAVLLTRNPDGLISALEKLATDKKVLRTASRATAHLFIKNPIREKGIKKKISGLFSTHPPLEERIERLRSM